MVQLADTADVWCGWLARLAGLLISAILGIGDYIAQRAGGFGLGLVSLGLISINRSGILHFGTSFRDVYILNIPASASETKTIFSNSYFYIHRTWWPLGNDKSWRGGSNPSAVPRPKGLIHKHLMQAKGPDGTPAPETCSTEKEAYV